MSLRRYSWVLAAVFGAACGDESKTPEPIPEPEAVQQRLTLQNFQSCQELEKYIEDTAVLDMKTTLEQYKKGYGGFWFGGPMRGGEVQNDAAAPTAGAGASAEKSAPTSHTTTNTQVAGVDEADFVKNDGTRIFVLSGNKLRINRSWPADQLALVSSVEIEGWPSEMFLDDKNRVVVFSNVYSSHPWDAASGRKFADCSPMVCGYYYANTVKVTVIDVTNLSAPVVKHESYFPGSYANSRRIGASVRLVLSDQFRYPPDVRFYPESNDPGFWDDQAKVAAAYDQLILQNEVRIRAQTLPSWLPPAWRKLEDGSTVKVDYDCADFARSNAPTKLGLVTVATLNLDNPTAAPSRTSVVAQAGEVYASGKHLYLASQHWWWWPQPGQQDWTYLHKFDIQNPDKATYVASGGVEGHIVDQFSMDENATGHFRVATTVATRVLDTENPTNWWGRVETTNRVSVLGEVAGELKVVGRTEDLAKGERIFSARFMGDKGYVVTFRQVDPLFTIDLSDPTAPKKVGELKVPGFSSYIHPLGDSHLLTIGTHVDEDPNAGWNTRALKLTVFDVSNFAQPKEAFTHLVGTANGWSEAQYEHKAFNYFAEKKLLAIPFSDWNYGGSSDNYWSSFVSEVRVFDIDTTTGISLRGAVSMKDIFQTENYYGWTYYWSPWIRRSVMADDFVYAVSDAGIRVANLASLATPVKTVLFPRTVETR